MKNLKKTFALVIILMLTSTISIAQDQNSIAQNILENYSKALKDGNLDPLMKLYTKDTSIRNSDGSMTNSLENIKAQYKVFLESGKYTIDLKTVDATMLDKDYLFTSGTYTIHQLDGEKSTTNGMYINVCQKVKNEWKILKSYRFNVTDTSAK